LFDKTNPQFAEYENVNIVVWDLNEEAMQAVAKELRAKGATALTYRVDVSKRERVYEVAKQVRPLNLVGWVGGVLFLG
jgi:FlaA1/EpsC-like NDP-sugar epimerase